MWSEKDRTLEETSTRWGAEQERSANDAEEKMPRESATIMILQRSSKGMRSSKAGRGPEVEKRGVSGAQRGRSHW